MSTKTALCTCQRFCQAPPEGKAVPIRTWYNHAAQRAAEEQMTQEQRDTQKSRVRKAKRTRMDNDTMIPENLEPDNLNPTDLDQLDALDLCVSLLHFPVVRERFIDVLISGMEMMSSTVPLKSTMYSIWTVKLETLLQVARETNPRLNL